MSPDSDRDPLPAAPIPAPPADRGSVGRGGALRAGMGAGVVALVAAVGAGAYGDVHSPELDRKLVAAVGTAVFVIFAVVALHALTGVVARMWPGRLGASRSSAVRVILRVVGYAVIVVSTLGLLAVPVGQLLLGGALTGIIVGVAAQQSLANFFAGIMLMFARPFAVGDHVQVHSGGLGGSYTGTVTDIGLTFVRIRGENGPVLLPNAAVLGSALAVTDSTDTPPAHSPPDHRSSDHRSPDHSVAAAAAIPPVGR